MEYQLKTGGVLRYRDWLVELGLRHMNYFCIDFEHLHSASSSNNIKIKSSCSATLQLMCHHTHCISSSNSWHFQANRLTGSQIFGLLRVKRHLQSGLIMIKGPKHRNRKPHRKTTNISLFLEFLPHKTKQLYIRSSGPWTDHSTTLIGVFVRRNAWYISCGASMTSLVPSARKRKVVCWIMVNPFRNKHWMKSRWNQNKWQIAVSNLCKIWPRWYLTWKTLCEKTHFAKGKTYLFIIIFSR